MKKIVSLPVRGGNILRFLLSPNFERKGTAKKKEKNVSSFSLSLKRRRLCYVVVVWASWARIVYIVHHTYVPTDLRDVKRIVVQAGC